MKCEKAQSLMLDSLYGNLRTRKQRKLEKHLAICAECSREYASQQATVSTFRQLEHESPPAALNEIVREMAIKELEQEALFGEKKRSFTYWKPALASVAAALLVVVGVVYYLPQARLEKQSVQLHAPAAPTTATEADTSLSVGGEHIAKAETERNLEPEALPPAETGAMAASPAEAKERRKAVSASRFADNIAAVEGSSGANAPVPAPEAVVLRSEVKKDQLPLSSGQSGSLALREKNEDAAREELPSLAYSKSMPAYTLSKEQEADAQKLFAKGNQYFDRKEYTQAADMYRQVVGLAPEVKMAVDAQFRLGQSYQAAGQYDMALTEYRNIIEKYPDYSDLGEVYLASGDCHRALGQFAEAIEAYETARDRFPELRDQAVQKLTAVTPETKPSAETGNEPAGRE